MFGHGLDVAVHSFIHSPGEGRLACVHVLVIVNKALCGLWGGCAQKLSAPLGARQGAWLIDRTLGV